MIAVPNSSKLPTIASTSASAANMDTNNSKFLRLPNDEFLDGFGRFTMNDVELSKISTSLLTGATTASTALMEDAVCNHDSFASSSCSDYASNTISSNTISSNRSQPLSEEQPSVEISLNLQPYVTQGSGNGHRFQRIDPYVEQPSQCKSSSSSRRTTKDTPFGTGEKRVQPKTTRQRIPRVTEASVPFQKTIPPTSYLIDEISKDRAYIHALNAGTLWQSLVGQHVKLPVLWYDGEEPARPYLGCYDPRKRNKWSYFGRHRVAGDSKLNALVKNSQSSGKLLLHIICRDANTLEPTEDLCVGVLHPNAKGIANHASKKTYNLMDQQRNEECRDVWVAHRSRGVVIDGRRVATRIESLLRHLNRNQVDKTPLGNAGHNSTTTQTAFHVNNDNMNSIFGRRPPRHTVFVTESKLYKLLATAPFSAASNNNHGEPSTPASVVLMRTFL